MAKIAFQLLPHNGAYPVNSMIPGTYRFYDDDGVVIKRSNPATRLIGRNGNERSEPKMYKLPAAGWEVDPVLQKDLYEFLKDHPHNTDSLAYKRITLGYSKEMEEAGVPFPVQAGYYLFKTVDEAKDRKVRMADQYLKQQASLLVTTKIGTLNEKGTIDFVDNGKVVMDKVYYMIHAKANDDKLAVIESLLALANSEPQRLIDLLNVDADVYNHKVRVNKWIADGVLTDVDGTIYLNGAPVGTRVDLETKSASEDENDIAFCKNLDGLTKPKLGRPKTKNA